MTHSRDRSFSGNWKKLAEILAKGTEDESLHNLDSLFPSNFGDDDEYERPKPSMQNKNQNNSMQYIISPRRKFGSGRNRYEKDEYDYHGRRHSYKGRHTEYCRDISPSPHRRSHINSNSYGSYNSYGSHNRQSSYSDFSKYQQIEQKYKNQKYEIERDMKKQFNKKSKDLYCNLCQLITKNYKDIINLDCGKHMIINKKGVIANLMDLTHAWDYLPEHIKQKNIESIQGWFAIVANRCRFYEQNGRTGEDVSRWCSLNRDINNWKNVTKIELDNIQDMQRYALKRLKKQKEDDLREISKGSNVMTQSSTRWSEKQFDKHMNNRSNWQISNGDINNTNNSNDNKYQNNNFNGNNKMDGQQFHLS